MNQNISELYKDVLWPMTKKDKAIWLAALRNGEYEQGKGCLAVLKDKTGIYSYCCLGVANKVCDLQSESSVFLRPGRTNVLNFLPMSVQDTLSNMNDVKGKSFLEIADYIEANIPAIDELT